MAFLPNCLSVNNSPMTAPRAMWVNESIHCKNTDNFNACCGEREKVKGEVRRLLPPSTFHLYLLP
jgi:hypothetical protein